MFENNITLIVGGALVLLLLAVLVLLASRKKPVYKKRGAILGVNEQRFLTALMQAIPSDTIITFKVRLLDIVSAVDANSGKSVEAHLADYVVDFVLVDRMTANIRLCIEMDAESQNASERLAKNTFISRALRKAGIPHLRLPLVRYYDPMRLRQVIQETLAASSI